ncbi:acetylcholine receptor subunit alpha-like isoform X3 [Pomacea canaliculata]|uniref:acetylcholine receptor subunit alpha-like isoform X3 n=1 Tax=Pomacea canaliculata TaxID=400727 RepID=UPI000D72A980|nr:acetylcholine receptor subunit alpha-like isoform X3 [Pomacea canaliculata]
MAFSCLLEGIFILQVFCLNLSTSKRVPVEMSHEKRLIRDLIRDYKSLGIMGRPVKDQNDTITISYGLSLIQIMDLDERNQILTTNVWATYNWNDMYLRWNLEEYGNITTVRVPNEDIWKPDIKLYNYADTRLNELRDAQCVVSHDGGVVWIPQAIFKSSCSIDITHFPFDVQTCHLKFGSWTYDGSKLDLQFLYGPYFELNDYIRSNEWDIVDSSAKRNVKYYPCCPEPYVDLVFNLKMRRKVAFYNYILILPCVLLSSLTLVLFWLPPESPAKMQLGMNIFVAFFVLLLLLAESTPPAASSIPLIGAYYCLNMVLITLSTLLSVVVVNLYFHGSRTNVPRLFKKIMVDVFAYVFCMRAQLISPKEAAAANSATVYATNARDRRLADIKYDRVGMSEQQGDTQRQYATTNGNPGIPSVSESDVPPEVMSNLLPQFFSLEWEVKEIRRHLKCIAERMADKEEGEKKAREWKVVALVLDRLFFFLYLAVLVVSAFTLFETRLLQSEAVNDGLGQT